MSAVLKSLWMKTVLFPGIIAFLFILSVCVILYGNEISSLNYNSEQDLSEAALFIASANEATLLNAKSIEALYLSSDNVTEEEFAIFSNIISKNALLHEVHFTLEWVDTNNVIRYIYPETEENKKVIGFDNTPYANRMEPINKAKATKSMALTKPIMLAQGYPGIIMYVPIFKGSDFKGMAISVVRLSELFKSIQSDLISSKSLRIVIDNVMYPLTGDAIYTLDGSKIISPKGDSQPDATGKSLATFPAVLYKNIPIADKILKLEMRRVFDQSYYIRAGIFGIVAMLFYVIYLLLLINNYKNQKKLHENYDTERTSHNILEKEIAQRIEADKTLNEQKKLVEEGKKEIENRNKELEKMNSFMIGREQKMIELKEEIETLKRQIEKPS